MQKQSIGLIAGNGHFPILFAKISKKTHPDKKIIAICFIGETSAKLKKYVDKAYWIQVGEFKKMLEIFIQEYSSIASKGYVVCRAPRRYKLSSKIEAIPWQELHDVLGDV